MMKPSFLALCISAVTLAATPVFSAQNAPENLVAAPVSNTLSLLIDQALSTDASTQQSYAQSQATREIGVASATLMDPKIKVGFGGLPTDSFKFDQDPMTNISVGFMQQFERGSTLALQAQKANQQADGIELQASVRQLEVINAVTQLWLELGYQQQAARILVEKQRLLRELEGFIQTNYSIGSNEAQDLLNAQLQVSKSEDKVQENSQLQQRIVSQLSEWLGSDWLVVEQNLVASNQLNWRLLNNQIAQSDATKHYAVLSQHPMIKMADVAISRNQTQVEIAEQAYKPQFGVEVMYAHRQANNMMGEPASDLVSAYLTLDIPLFTEDRQDRSHAAAQYQVGAAKSAKDLLLAQMNAKVNALLVDRSNLSQRLTRYQSSLLKQAKARTEAVERGYQNNTAQFNDVIAAANDELALELEQQRLLTDFNLVSSNLAALLGGFEPNSSPSSIDSKYSLVSEK